MSLLRSSLTSSSAMRMLRRKRPWYSWTSSSSLFSTSSSSSQVGVVFDIDGVLLRGYDPLPYARASLLKLLQNRIPFIFVTNGGGEVELTKAKKLATLLRIPVHEYQVVLSHT